MTIESDEVPVTWPDSSLFGPSIGSLRRTAAALQAAAGDQLLLTFNRDTSEAAVQIHPASRVESATSSDRSSMLTGLEPGLDFERRLSAAVGADSTTALRQRLRLRREDDLIPLLPGSNTDLGDALERLKEVL
jgi:hypothetical protein